MKKLLIAAVILTAGTFAAFAQPKAVGLRVPMVGGYIEGSYQHTLGPGFLQGDLALGPVAAVTRYDYDGDRRTGLGFGFMFTATYNYVFLKPNWTPKGEWEIFANAGLAMGYQYDQGNYFYEKDLGGNIRRFAHRQSLGFTIGLPIGAGLSYTFEKVPIQLSADIRPVFGIHMCKDFYPSADRIVVLPDERIIMPTAVGFYHNGLWGFIPTIAVRYAF